MATSNLEAFKMLDALANDTFELRVLRHIGGAPIRGYFNDKQVAAGAAIAANKNGTGVYVTVNQLTDSIEATNQLTSGTATKDKDITRRRHLVLDIDPEKPKGVEGTTEGEHKAVLELAQKAKSMVAAMDWPEPMLVDSGNGAYLIFRIDLPNDEESKRLVNGVLKSFAAHIDNEAGRVDQTVGNASRIFRLAGTMNQKGENSEERPHRMAEIISSPSALQTVSREQLKGFATPCHDESTFDGLSTGRRLDDVTHKALVQVARRALDTAGVQILKETPKEDFTRIELAQCTRGPEHRDGSSPAVLVWRNGLIGYKCFHSKCSDVTWATIRERFGISFDSLIEEEVTRSVTSQTERKFDDPLVLAEEHMKRWNWGDGTPTTACFHGQTWRHDKDDGWQETNLKDLGPWIRETVQRVFDQQAKEMSALKGKTIKAKAAVTHHVRETFNAMQSLCKHDVPIAAQSPFWLEGHDWDADDLLCFKNGVLNVRRFVDNEADYFMPLTPKLFYEYRAAFSFEQNAPRPDTWHAFLGSLAQDDDWIECLQQIMGYLLLLDYDLQKYFMLVGPPRSGKGTIANVMTNLLGGPRAICGPKLSDFASEFGLQQAIGKRLAIVPEARKIDDNVREIVEKIKAITGGDTIGINRKHLPYLTLRLKLRILMLTNHFVALPDNSGALQSRVLPLKLTKSFVGKEDRELATKLEAEYPGILLWALVGLRKLQAAGGSFFLPQSTKGELQQLQAEAAPLLSFVDECCSVDLKKGVQTLALHKVYQNWMKTSHPDDYQLNERDFGTELRSTVSTVKKSRAKKPGERVHDGNDIVATDYDVDRSKRSYLWLGIYPKPEWARKAELTTLA